MNDNQRTVRDLADALASAVQSALDRDPDLGLYEVCQALGFAAASASVARIPPSSSYADILSRSAMIRGFDQGLHLRRAEQKD